MEDCYEIFTIPIDDKKERVLISIKVPNSKIDEMATEIGLNCCLSLIDVDVNIETKFDPKRVDSF